MESLDFTDDELRTRHREARKLESLLRERGEAQAADHYAAVVRALVAEANGREISL